MNFSPELLPNKNTNVEIKNKKMNKEILAGTGDEQRTKDDNQHVSPACIKPNVMRRFVEEDLDNCWSHYKGYLIDILNGDYDLNEAREDLNGLIDSKYDKRKNNVL